MTSVAESPSLLTSASRQVRLRALVAGGCLAALVVLGRLTGALDGAAGLLLAAALVVLAPTGRTLSRRLLVSSGLLPWLAPLWWVRLPLGELGRVTLLLAAGAGILGGYVVAAPAPLGRLRNLPPKIERADLALPLVGLAACWPLWPWLSVSETRQALTTLLRGWDNSAHFTMTDMILREGAVTASLPASFDGSSWSFASYPQYFHSAMAALIELMAGNRPRESVQNLLPYAHASALILILGLLMVVAAVTSADRSRNHPILITFAATALTMIFAYGPGLRSLELGHTNFLLATEAVIASAALFIQRSSRPWLKWGALGGTLVLAANLWLPLGLLSGAMLLRYALGALRARKFKDPKMITLLAACGIGYMVPIYQISRVDVEGAANALGEAQAEDPSLQLATVLAAISVALLGHVLRRSRPSIQSVLDSNPGAPPIHDLALAPLTGLLLFMALFAFQLSTEGHIGYYALKVLTGTFLISCGFLAITLAELIPRITARTLRSVTTSALGLLACAIVAVNVSAPDKVRLGTVAPERKGAADRLLIATRTSPSFSRGKVVYVGTNPGDLIFMNGDQWFMSLTESWTASRTEVNASIPPELRTTADVEAAIQRILANHPDFRIIVNPSDRDWIRAGVGPSEGRVETWPG